MWTEWPHSAPMSYSLFWCHSHPSASFNCTYVVYVKPSTLTLCIQSASLLHCKYCHGNRQSFSFADIFCWLSIRGQNIFRFLHCISWIKTKPYLCNLGLQIEMRCRLMIDPGFIFENISLFWTWAENPWNQYAPLVNCHSLGSSYSLYCLTFIATVAQDCPGFKYIWERQEIIGYLNIWRCKFSSPIKNL